jgi:hypothetical protein
MQGTSAASIDSASGSYDWAVPSTGLAAFPVFGFKLQIDSHPTTFQISTYFSISGLGASSNPSASTTVTARISQVSSSPSISSASPSPSSFQLLRPPPFCVTHPIILHNFVILSNYLSDFLFSHLLGHQLQQWPQLRRQSRNWRRRRLRWHPSLGSHSIHILPVRQTGRPEE